MYRYLARPKLQSQSDRILELSEQSGQKCSQIHDELVLVRINEGRFKTHVTSQRRNGRQDHDPACLQRRQGRIEIAALAVHRPCDGSDA
jgi:ssDNA-binding Zn-finger/Zn-ribbon topoisomerase 1